MTRNRQLFAICLAALFVTTCGRTSPPSAGSTPAAAEPGFIPGLGELMSLQQMRHVKLWLAGEVANWELADYEVDELGEGFDDIIKFPPDAQGLTCRPEGCDSAHGDPAPCGRAGGGEPKRLRRVHTGVRRAHRGMQRLPSGDELRLQSGSTPCVESVSEPVVRGATTMRGLRSLQAEAIQGDRSSIATAMRLRRRL